MPLPLGHTAIGLAAYEWSAGQSVFRDWRRLILIAILANLPDIDVVLGLFFRSDGNAFHRGPTHGLLFAVVMAVLAWMIHRRWLRIPQVSLITGFTIVFSHVCADAWLTRSPVSFFWPLEVNWSTGHASLADVVHSVLFRSFQDGWIVLACVLILLLRRQIRDAGWVAKGLLLLPKPVLVLLQIKKDPDGRKVE